MGRAAYRSCVSRLEQEAARSGCATVEHLLQQREDLRRAFESGRVGEPITRARRRSDQLLYEAAATLGARHAG